MKYKWLNEEQTQVVRYEDGKLPITVPKNRFESWGINEWLAQGNEIEAFETGEEVVAREKLEREEIRDSLMATSPVILYSGNYYLLDQGTMNLLGNSRGALSRGKQLDFKVQDATTGEKKRVKLGIVELEKFEDALTDALNTIHVQADAQEPVNPWPLGVE